MENRNLQPEFHELLLESSQTLEASDHFDLQDDDPESARQFETLEARNSGGEPQRSSNPLGQLRA